MRVGVGVRVRVTNRIVVRFRVVVVARVRVRVAHRRDLGVGPVARDELLLERGRRGVHVLQQHLLGAWQGSRVQRLGLLWVGRAHGHMLDAHALGCCLRGARIGREIARGDGEDPGQG